MFLEKSDYFHKFRHHYETLIYAVNQQKKMIWELHFEVDINGSIVFMFWPALLF